MRTTIDSAGRIVVPKTLRDQLGLTPGADLEVRERDGRLEIGQVPTPMTLVKRKGVVVAVPLRPLPPLTDDVVRETLERTRR